MQNSVKNSKKSIFLCSREYIVEDDILTIEEVAKYLRVSERTVYDWAQKGEIPSGKIGTVWRFKKSEIEKWVNDRLSSNTKPAPQNMTIQVKNILSPERIVFLNHPTKHDALIQLSQNLATAIGRGIAIPHVRLSSVTDLVMSVGISRTDIIDFQTIDDTPVRLLFMIAAAYNQHSYYLQTLSFFSAKLKNQNLRDALFTAKSEADVYALLTK